MAEAAPTPKGKARWAFVTVLTLAMVIGLSATGANAVIRRLVEKSERAVVTLERLEGQANRLAAMEWQVIAEEGMTPETLDDVRETRVELTRLLRLLEQQDPGSQTLAPVHRAYDDYAAAVDDEFASLSGGSSDNARAVDRERVDPAFDALIGTLVPARETYGERAERLELISVVGFAVILFLANAATVGLFWGFQKAHRATERAVAEQQALASREECSRLLAEMGDGLRAAKTLAEAYEVVAHFALRLFPEDSGALYVFDESRDAFEPAQIWGTYPKHLLEPAFGSDECQALLGKHPFWTSDSSIGSACEHVRKSEPVGYVCLPLTSHGEILGVLHFRYSGPLDAEHPVESAVTSRRQLAITVAESVSLELSNMRLREALREQATHDPLSGLCNRRFMEATFDRELARAARHHTPVSVVMVDVDNFKSINDELGHAAGDSAIVELSDLLRESFREEDIICRYGGDEFVVVLPGTALSDARKRAERLQSEVHRASSVRDGTVLASLTLSLGISAYPQHGQTSGSLIDAADAALYRAKADGRDRVIVAADDDE